MTVPRKYADLAKKPTDLLTKHFSVGEFTLSYESPAAEQGLSYTVKGARDLASGSVTGHLEIVTKAKEYGLTLTEKWDSKNVLNTEVAVQDTLMKGLRVGADTSFEPYTGKHTAALKGAYQMPGLHATAKADLTGGPSLVADAVASYQSFFAGCTTTYDSRAGALTKNAVSVGYEKDGLTLVSTVDSSKVSAALHHVFADNTSVAMQLGWSKTTKETSLAFTWQKIFQPNCAAKVKVDNKGLLWLSYIGTANDVFDYVGTVNVDTANLNSGNHKVGFSLYFFHA